MRGSPQGAAFRGYVARRAGGRVRKEASPVADELTPEVRTHRDPGYDIAPLLLNRWSPRAMTGEPLRDDELMPLFEAARWAPSCFNSQLWRFLYARRATPH